MELTEFRDSLTETRRKIKMLQSAQEIEPDEPTAHQISMEAEKAVVLARAIQDAELPDAIDDALSTCYTNMALQGDDTLAGVLGPDLARISALRLNRLVPELNLPPVVTPAPTSIDRVCDHIDPPAPPIDALTPKPSEPTSPPIDALTPRGEETTDPPPSPPVQTHDVSEDPPGEETTDQDSTPPGYSHDVPDGYRRMRSRFAGTCKGCGDRFAKGTLIDWAARVGAYHPGCVPSATRVNDEEFDF